MKKIILIIIIFSFTSCSKDDCSDLLEGARNDYNRALNNAGGSLAAIEELTKEYNRRVDEINKNCD